MDWSMLELVVPRPPPWAPRPLPSSTAGNGAGRRAQVPVPVPGAQRLHMASYPLDSGSVGGRYRRPGLPSAVPGSVTIRDGPGQIRRRIVTSVDESVILG